MLFVLGVELNVIFLRILFLFNNRFWYKVLLILEVFEYFKLVSLNFYEKEVVKNNNGEVI